MTFMRPEKGDILDEDFRAFAAMHAMHAFLTLGINHDAATDMAIAAADMLVAKLTEDQTPKEGETDGE